MYLRLGLHPEPCWGSLQCSPIPLKLVGGSSLPLPNSRPVALNFSPSGLRSSAIKDMGSVNNQNCRKAFHFTEKVEKH